MLSPTVMQTFARSCSDDQVQTHRACLASISCIVFLSILNASMASPLWADVKCEKNLKDHAK